MTSRKLNRLISNAMNQPRYSAVASLLCKRCLNSGGLFSLGGERDRSITFNIVTLGPYDDDKQNGILFATRRLPLSPSEFRISDTSPISPLIRRQIPSRYFVATPEPTPVLECSKSAGQRFLCSSDHGDGVSLCSLKKSFLVGGAKW